MTVIYDTNGKALLQCQLPQAFQTNAQIEYRQYPSNRIIHLEMEAKKGNCTFVCISGESYIYEKKKVQMPFGFIRSQQQAAQNENGAWYAVPMSITETIDQTASRILNKTVHAETYYNLPEKVLAGLNQTFQTILQEFVQNAVMTASFQPIPLGVDLRNYLIDGGIGVYKTENLFLAVSLSRMGMEYDIVQRQGVMENITGEPFGQASDNPYISASTCEWSVPYICYMLSEEEKDLKDFMIFVETLEETDTLKTEIYQLRQQINQYQLQKARSESMQNQAMWNTAFAQQAAGWAASDRLRDSIHQDLDQFHANLHQQAAANDLRFETGVFNPAGESLDDRIQRMRHESIMGIETYQREDGSSVEFSNTADRVFENNLDNTAHFGTHNYFDQFVPDGWHELKKK